MYNPPRGDNLLLYITSGYSPPGELILHVSTEPISQSDVNAAFDAMIAESAAFNFESIDCAPIFGSLAAEIGASLPAPIGDTKLSTLRAETQSWHVIPCEAGPIFGRLMAESALQYRGAADGNATLFSLSTIVDFCLDWVAILGPLSAETATSLILPVVADATIGELQLNAQTSSGYWIAGNATSSNLRGESTTYIDDPVATTIGVLQFDDVDLEEIVPPSVQAATLSNILQFSR